MLSKSKSSTIVGLDIEAASIAATEVTVNGAIEIGGTGILELAPGVSREGEVVDAGALAGAAKEMFKENGLNKNVRVGVANQRVVVRTIRLPMIEDSDELETAIRFQAADEMPMPLEQAVVDWQIVRRGVGEDQRKMDVIVVAARREMVSELIAALRSAGLNPVGVDISAFGLIRALARERGMSAEDAAASYEQRIAARARGEEAGEAGEAAGPAAKLYCNLGDVTNLAVAQDANCLFTRVASFGIEGIAQRLSERNQLTLEHSRQWLSHVGLDKPLEAIEGDPSTVAATRDTLDEGAAKLADELRLSLDFYGNQEGAVAVDEIVAAGPGTAIEGLGERLQRDLGRPLTLARPTALDHLDQVAAARLTLSYGLALEG